MKYIIPVITPLLFLFIIISCSGKSKLVVRESPGEKQTESSYAKFVDPESIDTNSIPRVGKFEMVFIKSNTEQMRSNEELKLKAMKLGGNIICVTKTSRNAFNGSVTISGNIYKGNSDSTKITRFYRLDDGPIGKLADIKMKLNGKECVLNSNTYMDVKNSEFETTKFELNNRIIQLSSLPADQNNYIIVHKNSGSSKQGNIFGVYIEGVAINDYTELEYWSMGKSLTSCFGD